MSLFLDSYALRFINDMEEVLRLRNKARYELTFMLLGPDSARARHLEQYIAACQRRYNALRAQVPLIKSTFQGGWTG